ncbi:MAG TPA: tetratricopeptide repeat protein, partial [Herpetosiphonaceae bacterium]|nr:tetratricopeptide repeat protein [Herpetosiphonaceae bacterium]
MDRATSFAQALKQRRKALDLTQQELAHRVGCARVTIQRLEQATLRPSRPIVQRLADILELPADEHERFVRLARTIHAMNTFPTRTQHDDPDSMASSRSPLPVPLTPLIGRAREVAAVCEAFEGPTVRVLTLTGPGGIGKTRLALQVAADIAPGFADGAVFVDLAPIRDPTLVPMTIAAALGLPDVDGHSLLARLQTALRERQMLLVLDNFEQVATAAYVVADLLAAAAGLKVLLTSRSVVGVYGERDFPVPPLTLPDLTDIPRLDRLMQAETVRLFVERAQAAKPDFCLTRANAHAVRDICHHLEGLPLSIELAAARVRLFSPQALLQRLTRGMSGRLQVLTGGPRTLPARQQTLRSTVAWSYDLLDPREQRLFRRLAVFAGGCTLEAVEVVCDVDGDLARDALEGLQVLCDNHLLQLRESVDGEPHFSLLETIREYALEQLVISGELERLQQQHAAYFVTLAEAAEPALIGPRVGLWWDRLEREHANFRAALAWSRTAACRDTGLRLAVALGNFWARRGYLNEGGAWLAGALPQHETGASPYTEAYPALQAKALGLLGLFAQWQGDLDAAQRWHEESLGLFGELGDRAGSADQLSKLGMLFQLRGDYEQAGTLLEESLALSREIGDASLITWCRFFQGTLAYTDGNCGRAGELWEESLVRFRAEEQTWGIANVLAYLAMVTLDQGDDGRASAYLTESLTLLRELGERWQTIHTLEVCARLAAAR